MNELIIIQKIRNGDIKTYERVFKENYEMLCEYAVNYVRDYDLAEELVQDVFYHIWKKHSELEITSTVKGYLLQSVKNKCLQHIKHRNVEQKYAEKVKAEIHQIISRIDSTAKKS